MSYIASRQDGTPSAAINRLYTDEVTVFLGELTA